MAKSSSDAGETVHNFDIFDDTMLEVPSKHDPNLTEKQKEKVCTILVYICCKNVLENEDEVAEFEVSGQPMCFPTLTSQDLDKIAGKKKKHCTNNQMAN